MFGDQKYMHDNTFRRVVDAMRSILSTYHVTPGELREAVIVAATMHENENIRPLFIARTDEYLYKHDSDSMQSLMPYLLHTYLKPPSMFGGMDIVGCTTGRIQSDKPNFTEQDKRAGLDIETRKPKMDCICAAKRFIYALEEFPHSQTCKDYNWKYRHPTKPMTEHVYGEWHRGLGNDNEWRMCVRCHMSSTYIRYNKITACTGNYVPPKS